MTPLRVQSLKPAPTLPLMVRSALLRASRTMRSLQVVPRMRCGALDAAPLIRGRSKLGVWKGPGSAKQRCTLRRARDTGDLILRDAAKKPLLRMRTPIGGEDKTRFAR
jgi:hypothetical protein